MAGQQSQREAQAQPVRKPYATPMLHVYGAIHRLTQNISSKGSLDGGGGAAMGPKSF
jgi:hypothetical protein